MAGLPTPPNEGNLKPQPQKRQHSNSKPVKPVRAPKRASTHANPASPTTDAHSHAASADGRHKRVWKACERCRMKKTKCDGEFPCKKCKDDGLVCIPGARKKIEYKQMPPGYAEVMEATQLALVGAVHKLYSMVRNHQAWELGEPEINERGQPVIHNIAFRLGCIRPNHDVDLPVHSIFPEDEAGIAELARRLEEHHKEAKRVLASKGGAESAHDRVDRASSSELDHSDFEDYRRAAFAGSGAASALTMSPQSLSYNEFDLSATPPDQFTSQQTQAPPPPPLPTAAFPWQLDRPASMGDFTGQPFPSASGTPPPFVDMLGPGFLGPNYGTIKPHVLSCPNPEAMMGMGDPMIYSGYDVDSL